MPLSVLISIFLVNCMFGVAQAMDIPKSELAWGETEVALTSLSYSEGEALIACGKTKENCTWGTYTLIEGEALQWHTPCSSKLPARLIAWNFDGIYRVTAVANTRNVPNSQKCSSKRKILLRQKVSIRVDAPASKILIAHRTSKGFRHTLQGESPNQNIMLSEWKFHPAF